MKALIKTLSKPIFPLALLITSTTVFADSEFINQDIIMQKPFRCTNGVTLKLSPTRYNALNKVTLIQEGSIDLIGYADFNFVAADYYSGYLHTSLVFPAGGGMPRFGKTYGMIRISVEKYGLLLETTPLLERDAHNAMVCRNY